MDIRKVFTAVRRCAQIVLMSTRIRSQQGYTVDVEFCFNGHVVLLRYVNDGEFWRIFVRHLPEIWLGLGYKSHLCKDREIDLYPNRTQTLEQAKAIRRFWVEHVANMRLEPIRGPPRTYQPESSQHHADFGGGVRMDTKAESQQGDTP